MTENPTAQNVGCGGVRIDPGASPGPVRMASTAENPDNKRRFVISRYDDAVAALSDLRLSNQTAYSANAAGEQAHEGDLLAHSMIALDPPGHSRLRRLVVRWFSAKRVEALRPRIQQIADDLLDTIAQPVPQVDTFDLTTAYALPLPVQVISHILGVPADVSRHLLQQASTGSPVPMIPMDAVATAMTELIDKRRTERTPPPDDDQRDLLSTLMAAQADGQLSHTELVQMAGLLFSAGHVTTGQLIGRGVVTLLRHPDQFAELQANPGLIPGAVGELLRHVGPVPAIPRYATEDVEIDGTTIPAGSHVTIALTTANHDPVAFPEPEKFDLHREHRGDVAFGHGIHFCLGAKLAAVEAEIAIATLLRRYPEVNSVRGAAG